MIFLAPRISESYFHTLNTLRSDNTPCSLVTGNLGLGWLHGVSQCTQEIHIFDTDTAVLNYNKAIVRLILESRSLIECVSFLSGRSVRAIKPLEISLEQIPFHRVWEVLQDVHLYGIYLSTIGLFSFDKSSNTGVLGDSRILFTGATLAPQHYCWRIGEGVFANEESFGALKSALRNAVIKYHRAPLHDINWKMMNPSLATVIVAGNMDSPLYVRGDPLLQTIPRDAGPVRHLSWKRDVSLEAASIEISEYLDKVICSGDAYALGFHHDNCTLLQSIDALYAAKLFGRKSLIIDLDKISIEDSAHPQLFDAIIPCFHNIIVFANDSGAPFLKNAAENGLFCSFETEALWQRSGQFLLHVKLRGVGA